jgi:hypothetical protein
MLVAAQIFLGSYEIMSKCQFYESHDVAYLLVRNIAFSLQVGSSLPVGLLYRYNYRQSNGLWSSESKTRIKHDFRCEDVFSPSHDFANAKRQKMK